VQVLSLTYRNRYSEAFGFGLDSLRELGITIPAAARLAAALDHQFDYLYRWLDHTDAADDLTRPELTDPTLLAVTRLTEAVMPVAYFLADLSMHAWLSLEALRIWLEHGWGRTLIGPAGGAAFAAVALRGDHAAAHRALRRALTLGEACGHEPETSQARFRFATLACWFEPIENAGHEAQQARAELIAGGDLTNAGYAYPPRLYFLLDCAPSLASCVAEVEAGTAFTRRTGAEQIGQWFISYRWLAGVRSTAWRKLRRRG